MYAELIKDGVVKVGVSRIGTKFENFVQAGCRDLGSHCGALKAQPGTPFLEHF